MQDTDVAVVIRGIDVGYSTLYLVAC